MSIPELETQLAAAKDHLAVILKTGIRKEKLNESLAAFAAVASAQRALAAAGICKRLGFYELASAHTFPALAEVSDTKKHENSYAGVVRSDLRRGGFI